MRKFIVLLFFVAIATTSFAQNPWKGFWKPVSSDKVFTTSLQTGLGTFDWKFRPTVTVVAQKYTFTGDDRVIDVSTLNSAGVGLSIEHFIDIDGVPYNNFGVTAALLINHDINQPVAISPCPFVGVTALQYLNAGIGYDIGAKKLFMALGVSYSFN